jgi:hypothetical protein
VAPLGSSLQFSDPAALYAREIAPRLADYMGWSVFEEICAQWLERNAESRLGLSIRRLARYWSRDGRIEIDLMAELSDGTYLFGECKWRPDRPMRLADLATLQAKVESVPEAAWRQCPNFILFTVGEFAPELQQLAADPAARLTLVSGCELLPGSDSAVQT